MATYHTIDLIGRRGSFADYKKRLATFVGPDKAPQLSLIFARSRKRIVIASLNSKLELPNTMCSLQRLALSILLIGASLQLSASWPNRLTRTTVCQDLHVTHPGQNLVLSRGNVSLILLKNGREVSCYEPEQEYEGMHAVRERERERERERDREREPAY